MKYFPSFIAFGILLVSACSSGNQSSEELSAASFQAVSALGDTLRTTSLDPATQNKFKSKLDTAQKNYEANPNNADALIWYGRRTAYLGNYQKAIAIFSKGIEQHPKEARLYRHRGHRYITTRQFNKAIKDLNRATELIYGMKDQVEPDGLPNQENDPRSTLHTNIWYHLGLAHYLKGEFEKAKNAYEECLRVSTNDDMLVATSYWLYMTLRRNGMDDLAGNVLKPISEEMNIIENKDYHRLLLVFKGVFKVNMIQENLNQVGKLQNATLGYGLGNWHYINGRQDRAEEFFNAVYETNQWNTFGYIAAETDLNRLFEK